MMMFLVYGCLISQVATYVSNYNYSTRGWADPAMLVAGVFAMTTTNLCLLTYQVWKRFVDDREVPVDLWRAPNTVTGVGVLNGLIAASVMLFFARKVWVLGAAIRRPIMRLPGLIIAFLAVCHAAVAVATAIIFRFSKQDFFANAMSIVIGLNLTTALSADIAITTSMVLLLRHYKRRSSFSRTKNLLNTITRHTLENGLITTVCACGNLIVYYARLGNVHEAFRFPIFVLYALVLVTSLNRGQAAQSASRNNTTGLTISGNSIPLSAAQFAKGTRTDAAGNSVTAFTASGLNTAVDGKYPPVQVHVSHQVEHCDRSSFEPDAKGAKAGWEDGRAV